MRSPGDPNALPRMDTGEWDVQPYSVWAYVEIEAERRWPFKVRQAIGNAPGPGDIHEWHGWLSIARGIYAEGIGVPIGRLFTAGRIHALAGTMPVEAVARGRRLA